jgi:FkbM family methyltransferase
MPNNFSSFAMCVAGARDPHLWRFIAGRLRPGSTVVDAGANIGTYTIPAARRVAPAGRVVAFEAHPGIMRFLARNIAANALTNVIARNMALGAAPGVIDMVFSAHNPGETHVAGPDESTDGRVRVEMTTLDEALAGIGIDAVDYLKIDVEGFELQVLEGARRTIAANPDIVVQTEIETAHADRYGQGRGEMAALLQGLGLTPHEVDRQGRATRLGVSVEQLRYGDLLWFRA